MQICSKIGRHKIPRSRAVTRTSLKAADREIEVFFDVWQCRDTRPATVAAGVRMCGEKCKETGKKHHGQWGSPQAVSKLCDSVCSLKCIHLRKRALSSSHSQYNSARPASEWYGAANHTGYSRVALASDSNDQAAKASMSITESVENYSKNLTLVTLHTAHTPQNSV